MIYVEWCIHYKIFQILGQINTQSLKHSVVPLQYCDDADIDKSLFVKRQNRIMFVGDKIEKKKIHTISYFFFFSSYFSQTYKLLFAVKNCAHYVKTLINSVALQCYYSRVCLKCKRTSVRQMCIFSS